MHPTLPQATGSARAAAVLAEFKARRIPSGGPRGMAAQAAALIAKHSLDDTLYVYDLGNTIRLFQAWRAAMPRVVPYYAVKCNPEPALLKLLAALGAGFDCASKAELEGVLGLGVSKERLIFAHPCKRPCDLRFARENGIQVGVCLGRLAGRQQGNRAGAVPDVVLLLYIIRIGRHRLL